MRMLRELGVDVFHKSADPSYFRFAARLEKTPANANRPERAEGLERSGDRIDEES